MGLSKCENFYEISSKWSDNVGTWGWRWLGTNDSAIKALFSSPSQSLQAWARRRPIPLYYFLKFLSLDSSKKYGWQIYQPTNILPSDFQTDTGMIGTVCWFLYVFVYLIIYTSCIWCLDVCMYARTHIRTYSCMYAFAYLRHQSLIHLSAYVRI